MTAKAPPGASWQMGKTAPSIRFHDQARDYLQSCTDNKQRSLLEKAMSDIEAGKIILYEWITPVEYLAQALENATD